MENLTDCFRLREVPFPYPKMHLDDYWKPLFRNPSSLYKQLMVMRHS